MTHSPLPWTLENGSVVTGDGTRWIAGFGPYNMMTNTDHANAAFMVKACNLHDRLVAASEACAAWHWAERINPEGITFHDKMELCNYSEWLTQMAIREARGLPADLDDYEGVPRITVWPTIQVDKASEERAQAIVDKIIAMWRAKESA